MIKVIAKETGYFGERRRREGDAFELDSPEQFSDRWMQLAGSDAEIKANEKLVRAVLDAKEKAREERKQAIVQGKGLPQSVLDLLVKLQQENQELKAKLEGGKPEGKSESKPGKK